MNVIKRHLSMLAFNKKDYMDLRQSIRISNFKSLRTLSLIATLLFGLLFVISGFTTKEFYSTNGSSYLISFLINLIVYYSSPFVVKYIPSAVACLEYVFIAGVHTFGIFLGVINSQAHPATTYIVLLFVIPLMFVERPWRVSIFNLLSGSVYLYLSYKMKSFDVFLPDCVNVFSFYILGIVCGRYFTQVKIQQLKFIKLVETERDTDHLTGVLTKSAFLRELERLLSIDSSQGVFVMIDVDNFKKFNDTYGHDFGDKVLKALGDSMNNSFRRSDLLGRFGGDEFFVFIPSTNDTDIALYRAKSLQLHLASDIKVPDGVEVTISIGISNCKGFGETYESLMKRADEAIYEAKASGKNAIIVK